MKKWVIGLIILGILTLTLVLSAMTMPSSNMAIDISRTQIANLNTTTEAQIRATSYASTYGSATPAPTMNASQPLPAATMTVAAQIIAEREASGIDNSSQNTTTDQIQSKRIVIYTANLRITADDPDGVIDDIGILAEDLGGWIVTSNTNSRPDGFENYRTSGTIQVRIPADQLNYAVDVIKSYALVVTSEVITGEDVTNQYVDMAGRLKNLQASEDQLQLIMQAAEDVGDVLATFNELTRIRGQIESIQGQLSYYDESSTFSGVTVNVDSQIPTPTPIPEYRKPEWNPSETVDSALEELEGTVQKSIDGLIRFAIVGGPFLLIFLIISGIVLKISLSVWQRTK